MLPGVSRGGDADELCAMFDESSQCTIVLPVECLGYGLVVPFLAYRFASLVSHNKSLNSGNKRKAILRARGSSTVAEEVAGDGCGPELA
eukprot:scaffold104190_cov67-Phaeocystis_antarctica.AAC.3